jgi:hypothetical protein
VELQAMILQGHLGFRRFGSIAQSAQALRMVCCVHVYLATRFGAGECFLTTRVNNRLEPSHAAVPRWWYALLGPLLTPALPSAGRASTTDPITSRNKFGNATATGPEKL